MASVTATAASGRFHQPAIVRGGAEHGVTGGASAGPILQIVLAAVPGDPS